MYTIRAFIPIFVLNGQCRITCYISTKRKLINSYLRDRFLNRIERRLCYYSFRIFQCAVRVESKHKTTDITLRWWFQLSTFKTPDNTLIARCPIIDCFFLFAQQTSSTTTKIGYSHDNNIDVTRKDRNTFLFFFRHYFSLKSFRSRLF